MLGETQRLAEVPRVLTLDNNAPNPFNARTRIRFGLPAPTSVTLSIYDARGKLVGRPLRNTPKAAGFHTVIWEGTDEAGRAVGSGVYFYRLHVGSENLVRKMVVVK